MPPRSKCCAPLLALYGSASGGVIALQSRWPTAAQTRKTALSLSSAFGLRQMSLSLDRLPAEGQALSLTAQLTHRDGFRPHSGSERRLLGRWRLRTPEQQLLLVAQLQKASPPTTLGPDGRTVRRQLAPDRAANFQSLNTRKT